MDQLSKNAEYVLTYLSRWGSDPANRVFSAIRIRLDLSKHDLLRALEELVHQGMVTQNQDWWDLTPAGEKSAPQVEQGAFVNPAEVRVLIIDDDRDWQTFISKMAEKAGFSCQSVGNFDEAEMVLKQAEANHNPFTVVTLDLFFEFGTPGQSAKTNMGIFELPNLQEKFPYLGYIIITHSDDTPYHQIMDWRDELNLDYYIFKYHLTLAVLRRGIERAAFRARQRRPRL